MNTGKHIICHCGVVLRSVLIVLGAFAAFASLSAQTASYIATAKKTNAGASLVASKQAGASGGGNIWLSLDVVEHQYNASGSEVGKEKFRTDVDVQVIDSASNRQITVRSGETIQLQPRRTYYLMLAEVPQRYGMITKIAGQQTQVIRTPKASAGDDVMFERKFVLNSRPGSGGGAAAREMNTPVPLGAKPPLRKMPPPDLDDDDAAGYAPPASGFLSGKLSAPNYYVIQYCSLKNQADALEARSFLMRNGIRDARVEIYVDKFGDAYYRLRSGSYADLNLAKMTVEQNIWKNRKFLGLKQKPIIVKAGV